jgi:hypothetical protein
VNGGCSRFPLFYNDTTGIGEETFTGNDEFGPITEILAFQTMP